MIKTFCYIVLLAILNVGPAVSAHGANLVIEPSAASTEISQLLADAKPVEAAAAVAKYLPSGSITQTNLDQLKSALTLLTKNGKADLRDEVQSKKYGSSICIIIQYVHFPYQEMPINQFVFLRYTFMKGGKGWTMTNFDFKTAGLFPPPGWGN